MAEGGVYAATAQRKPGKLLLRASQAAERCLAPRSAAAQRESPMAPRWEEYVSTRQAPMEARDRQEMQTIAACLDRLITGRYLELGDILAQRVKALELSALGAPPETSSQMELVAPLKSLLTPGEKAKATRAAALIAKTERSLGGK